MSYQFYIVFGTFYLLKVGKVFHILCFLQCDQKKSPNVYKKLPKNDFNRKMKDFNNFTKIA